MNQPFEDAKRYDQLEALAAAGVDPDSPEVGDLADELRVVQLLSSGEQPLNMPREVEFRKLITRRIQTRRRVWHQAAYALAAVVLIGLTTLWISRPAADANKIVVDAEMLALAGRNHTEQEVLEYLDRSERLLLSIRDYHVSCAEDQTDISPEKQLAQDLLLKQKRFASRMNQPKYFQVRGLFNQLESILVDLNGLDPCTDPSDMEFLNEHINENRILSKIRLIAREIEVS
jgi:hypothetical protein